MKAATEQSERNPLDLVAEEFADKCRRGLNPSIEEYVRNNPEMSAELRELLPTVVMMEQLKVRKKSEGIPERLGEYHILREIGRGGMGVVYEAEHKALGRRVALKVAPAHLLIDPMRLQRFQREAQAAARLHHTNIVPVFGMGESSGLHYIIMQYISGCSLNQLLAGLRKNSASGPASLSQVPPPRGPRYWNWVAQIGVQVADALGYAHDQATLHRDIKPGNILLDAHGTAWVADFGLAKISGRDDLTQTGDIIGTLQYMAPEALQGCGDTRSDLYSVALTLYELLTLQSPFPELGTLELVKTIGEKEPPRPRAINADIPVDLETIILKGSARNPADRYQTAAQFADDLRCFLEDRPIAARPVRMHERCWRWCRRNRALAGAGAIAVASFICALVAGWVGYVSTTAALERESQRRADAVAARKRAEQNVQMSLQAFEDIFHQLEPSDGFAPPRRPRMAPPDPNRGPRGNGENGPPPPDGPGGSPRRESEENLAVLQSVLKFYERFAAENETNINLQYEAAKAYGRVGEIQHRLGDLDKAAATLTRAVQMMTKLHSSYPENDTYTELTGLVSVQLGSLLQLRRQTADAEKLLRQGVSLLSVLFEKNPAERRYRIFLAREQLTLGDFLTRERRYEEARKLVEASLNSLQSGLLTEPRLRPLLVEGHYTLANIYRNLGNEAASAKATQTAETFAAQLREARPLPRPGGNNRLPPPPDFERQGQNFDRQPRNFKGPPPPRE